MTGHARRQAGQRCILDEDVVIALAEGELLEDYPEDPRGPCCLILGHLVDGSPLHAVCTIEDATLLIITVYKPAMPYWWDERTRA